MLVLGFSGLLTIRVRCAIAMVTKLGIHMTCRTIYTNLFLGNGGQMKYLNQMLKQIKFVEILNEFNATTNST